MLRKKVKLLLEHLQVCIFAEIVFGVRCTLSTFSNNYCLDVDNILFDLYLLFFRFVCGSFVVLFIG